MADPFTDWPRFIWDFGGYALRYAKPAVIPSDIVAQLEKRDHSETEVCEYLEGIGCEPRPCAVHGQTSTCFVCPRGEPLAGTFSTAWPTTRQQILDAIDWAAKRMSESPPPAPCGTKKSPHIVSPECYRGGRGYCVQCGERFPAGRRPQEEGSR